jgi:tetratricopeptide (TPR) repeat protein
MYEEAIECFNKDLTINDQSFESFYKKGISLYKLKKFKEAIECFNKAWQSNYSHYLKTKNHIDELKLRRQYELALLQSTELNQSKSIPVKFWYYKGLALSECAEYKEAVDCYDQALKLVSDDVSVLFEKARCELHLGEKESCLILLKKICSSDIKMLEKILKDKTFQLFNEE